LQSTKTKFLKNPTHFYTNLVQDPTIGFIISLWIRNYTLGMVFGKKNDNKKLGIHKDRMIKNFKHIHIDI